MRRSVLLVAAWLVGGALAVLLASVAVGRVGNEVTGSRPAPLSAGEVEEQLAATTSSTTAPSTVDTTATTTPVTTTTTAGSVTTATVPAPAEVRTYPLVGGTATLRFSAEGVTVVTATPNPGFSVDVEPEHGNGVKVEFEGEGHESRVDGWWSGGPQDEVREEPS